MIRYVLLGAVVGFVVAYFLLSSGSKDLTAPPPDAAPHVLAAPARPNPEELMRMQPLPANMARRGMPLDGDAGPR